MTFTLDTQTAIRFDQTASRLGMSKSGVVREAVREYAARVGQLTESERLRLLGLLDAMLSREPTRPAAEVERELKEIRGARRGGGRHSGSAER